MGPASSLTVPMRQGARSRKYRSVAIRTVVSTTTVPLGLTSW
jgi:hypothetical protein